MIKIGIITRGDSIPREIWRSLPAPAKLVRLAAGEVTIDDDGLPVLSGELLASRFAAVCAEVA
jgi:hypothetical protein